MCGLATTCGSLLQVWSVVGSACNTSSAAPPMWPLLIASTSAGFVDQLAAAGVDNLQAFLHFAKRSALNVCAFARWPAWCSDK
jgi:hypothetical protein